MITMNSDKQIIILLESSRVLKLIAENLKDGDSKIEDYEYMINECIRSLKLVLGEYDFNTQVMFHLGLLDEPRKVVIKL